MPGVSIVLKGRTADSVGGAVSATDTTESQEMPTATVSKAELCRYFLRLGALGFGGPIALSVTCSAILSRSVAGLARMIFAKDLPSPSSPPGHLPRSRPFTSAGYAVACSVQHSPASSSSFPVISSSSFPHLLPAHCQESPGQGIC